MDSPKIVYKYYSNPAFCSQSEIYGKKRIISPDRRMPPIGSNSPRKTEIGNRIVRTDISDNPLRMTRDTSYSKTEQPPELPPKPVKFQKQFVRQSSMIYKPSRQVRCRTRSEDLEMAQFKQKKNHNRSYDDCLEERNKHRYEEIDFDYSPTKKRLVEVDADEYNVDGPDENELKEIPTEIVKTVNGRTHRYAIVPSDDDEPVVKNVSFTGMSQKNLIATQKLHELLSTPRKLKSYASQPSVRSPNKSLENRYLDIDNRHFGTPKKIISSTPTHGVTPSKSCANLTLSRSMTSPRMTSPISPKAQQKLSYGLTEDYPRDVFVTSARENDDVRESRRNFDRSFRKDKTTAVIVPRVAQPPSVYSEDTYKSFSLVKTAAGAATLTIAALMLTLCGGLSTGLSFYMMYAMGRHFYLDFGVMAGFTSFLLGLLGLRSRRHQMLPNRNYISGYIVLSSFSLLSAFGLLLLLTVQPKPGSALNDITSGAVCGVSILSLMVASAGVLTSYCCARDPPDNRVGSATWY